jgi:phosphomannomutase
MRHQEGSIAAFKAYDLRGRVPDELDAALAADVGRAYARVLRPRRVVVGHDIRLSSPELDDALVDGLTRAGVDVVRIGQCGTEEIYFATFHLGVDGGIMITASHNPIDYNGMKLVREGARPVSGDTGLRDIERAILEGGLADVAERGSVEEVDVRGAFVDHVLGMVEVEHLEPMKIVANPGNGAGGPVVELLAQKLPFQVERVHFEPDGRFPNGVPNPLLPANRVSTAEAVEKSGAHMGVAWDGDYDRCFFFDERGRFIEGYYIVGLLASQILPRYPGGKIIHDPRLVWNTVEVVREAGGTPVQSKSGHAFIKERMRQEDAVYGGEMSAHHYFREFSYCDSGMAPWLLVAQAMSVTGKPLSELVDERINRYPASGEINRKVSDPDAVLRTAEERYSPQARAVDKVDGVSVELDRWRFNLRKSNTEPVVRLNVEARGDRALMQEKTDEILEMMREMGAVE